MNIKAEENAGGRTQKSESAVSVDPVREYEQMVQKLEEETRNHVRIEQQLKLHIEGLQFRVDELEAKLGETASKLKKSHEESIKKEQEAASRKKKSEEKYEKLKAKYKKLVEPNPSPPVAEIVINGDVEDEDYEKETKEEGLAKSEKPSGLNKVIKSVNAQKGVEQNIYQIICNNTNSTGSSKSGETVKGKTPYFMEFVNQKLEGKEQEISKLKQKLSKLQTEIRMKHVVSREANKQVRKTSLDGYNRSKSQSNSFFYLAHL